MHNGYQIVFLIYSISVCLDFPYYFIYRQKYKIRVILENNKNFCYFFDILVIDNNSSEISFEFKKIVIAISQIRLKIFLVIRYGYELVDYNLMDTIYRKFYDTIIELYYFTFMNKSQKVAYNPHSLEHPESHTKCALNNLNAGTIVNFKYGDRTY